MGIKDLLKKENRNYSTFIEGNNFRSFSYGDRDILNDLYKLSSFIKGKDLICSSISSLPIYLYKEENGDILKINDDYRLKLLNDNPNLSETANEWKERLIEEILTHGVGYSFIDKKGNKINSINSLKTNSTQKKAFTNEFGVITHIKYDFTLNGVRVNDIDYDNILRIKYGKGVMNYSNIINNLLELIETEKTLLDNVTSPSGILKTQGRLSDTVIDRLRESWNKLYSGSSNAFKTIILEEGLSYEKLSNDISDFQIDKKQIDSEIEKILNLPIGILQENATMDFQEVLLVQTLQPLISAIESGLNDLLLTSEQQKGYFFRFDTSEFVRSTESERNDNVINLFKNGLISINEARYKLDLDSVNKDYYTMSLGDVIKYKDNTNTLYIPNMGQVMRLSNESIDVVGNEVQSNETE
ncbi:phage portal protein [Paraclostridium bifermentans]|uniref:phage portal protein n=1 Tax=Paraclostridium bifermentans TaxID=1490 RepID=UPI00241F2839|nr:phage portal protein [Paraclostridium bifermentans]